MALCLRIFDNHSFDNLSFDNLSSYTFWLGSFILTPIRPSQFNRRNNAELVTRQNCPFA
jgi:hypothetical protein